MSLVHPLTLFVRATVDENLEGILRGCPMTGKCAKVKRAIPSKTLTQKNFIHSSNSSDTAVSLFLHFTRKRSAETMSQKRRSERQSLPLWLSTQRSPPDLIHGKWPVIKPKPLALNRSSALLGRGNMPQVVVVAPCQVQLIKCSTGCRAEP